MPTVDTPYIIAVIREKEKTLLEADEYTRLIEAPTAEASAQSLVDTVYGVFMEGSGSPLQAIDAHLVTEMKWLREMVDDARILEFLGARYDGLNLANGILDVLAGRDNLSYYSELGVISEATWRYLLWDKGDDVSALPMPWRTFVSEQLSDLRSNNTLSASEVLVRMKTQVASVMHEVAFTDLMTAGADLYSSRLSLDEMSRGEVGDALAQEPTPDLTTQLPEEAYRQFKAGTSATAYEAAFDERLLDQIRRYKTDPIGYDPILAYWYAKEVEARCLRLLLSAKFSGLPEEDVRLLQRSLYLPA